MAAANQVFQRVEKKYLLNDEQYYALLERMKPYMTADSYGLHTICNIYYDTKEYDLIGRSLEKPVYKEKFRIRSYGVPTKEDKVFLEIKKKYKGVVFKRRISMTLQEASDYLNHGIKPKNESQIFHEIDYFLKLYQPEAKLYLAYDRIAFFGTYDPEFRMTFDVRIRSRENDLALEDGDDGKLLLPDDMHLLEIKINEAVPIWLSRALSELEIFPVSFSKYGSIYKKKMEKSFILQKDTQEECECLQVLLNQGA